MKRLFGLAAAILIAAASAPAQAGCAQWEAGAVHMNYIFPAVTYDFNHSFRDLSNVDDGGLETLTHGSKRVGLAVSQQLVYTKSMMQFLINQRTGRTCARVSKLEVTFGYNNNKVYVARELAPNDCLRRDVLNHEYRHVMTNYGILKEYGPVVQEHMRRTVSALRFVEGSSQADATAQIDRAIDAAIDEVMKQVSAENERRQKLIDTPEEYRRGSMACGGAMQALLRQ